jgi:hypothetical protein
LAGLALHIPKSHWWHDSFHNIVKGKGIKKGRKKRKDNKQRKQKAPSSINEITLLKSPDPPTT